MPPVDRDDLLYNGVDLRVCFLLLGRISAAILHLKSKNMEQFVVARQMEALLAKQVSTQGMIQ